VLAILKRAPHRHQHRFSPVQACSALAVGFGSQTLIKDVIAGLFLLIENQIRVNDTALINGVAGTVEEVNLRTTVIRAENGGRAHLSQRIHHGPRQPVPGVRALRLRVPGDPRNQRRSGLCTAMNGRHRTDAHRTCLHKDLILGPLEVHGVDKILEPGVLLRGRIKTLPHKQWGVGREANKRIRTKLRPEHGVSAGESRT
jgi:moderate conductance mechanosensitive channel